MSVCLLAAGNLQQIRAGQSGIRIGPFFEHLRLGSRSRNPQSSRIITLPPCFSPDGGQLAVATHNHAIQLWDLRLIRRQLQEMDLDWDMSEPK